MAITTKLARKVLTKKEQRHLTENHINSMSAMESQVESMKEMKPDFPSSVCFECANIARKLGLEV